jgi:hypothetical protein
VYAYNPIKYGDLRGNIAGALQVVAPKMLDKTG